MKLYAFTLLLGAGFLFPVTASTQQSACRIWKEHVTIPTYQTGEPDPYPRFYDGRVTQGAQGRVYPYPMSDVLLMTKEQQAYDVIYMENEYIKISVIPELGGRIFSAVDKTNNYNFFYRQGVIKPALIGTLGKWISGGSEWNFPHHHKATTMMTMDHLMQENSDGSVTLWLAETERRHRLRITLSITIHPGRSYIEMGVNPYNPTPFVHSFLYFANPAVHVDSTYQVIFPPGVSYVTQHAKSEFVEWPVANGRYGGKYYDGVDISWWKNLASPVSFFAWNDSQDFFAGYDHGKQAGVAYVSNHHTAPGMKFFTFGCGESGRVWDERLTDRDGPYLELMAGVYSDNQPDYSWAQPFESKMATQYWYPVRELGGMQHADLNGAVQLELDSWPEVALHLNTTSKHDNAKVRITSGKQVLWETGLSIGPAAPFNTTVRLKGESRPQDLKIGLIRSDGTTILAYAPEVPEPPEMPVGVIPPPPPEKIETVEELYLAGLRLNQFYNAQVDPMPYYEEALRRDSENYSVNTQLGILACRGFRWKDAEAYLRRAVRRATWNHTRPKDGEALYYLGISLREQGRNEEAFDAFYRASWSLAWSAASYLQLAELNCHEGAFGEALDHVNRSLGTNGSNLLAMNLKAVILRKLGRSEEAASQARSAMKLNPLDLMARYELGLIEKSDNMVQSISRGEVETYLELASWYVNWGCWEEALALLSHIDISIHDQGTRYPMIYYYVAYCKHMLGNNEDSGKYLELAAWMPIDYCFPYRKESLHVLDHAIRMNAKDANAHFYLGNMLFDHQPEKAKLLWESARGIDDSNPVLHRNLGLAYQNVDRDYQSAMASYRRSLEIKPDPRVIYELDLLSEMANTGMEVRKEIFDRYSATANRRVDSRLRQVLVQIQSGQYDQAIDILNTSYFYRWEGGREVRYYYEDAHLLRGIGHLGNGRITKALKDFRAATEYPENLEEGRPEFNERFARIYYYLGVAEEEKGNQKASHAYFEKAAGEYADGSLYLFYNIMALRKLQREDETGPFIDRFMNYAERGSDSRFFAKFGERMSPEMKQAERLYVKGLAYLAANHRDEARESLGQALALNPNHTWASVYYKETLENL